MRRLSKVDITGLFESFFSTVFLVSSCCGCFIRPQTSTDLLLIMARPLGAAYNGNEEMFNLLSTAL